MALGTTLGTSIGVEKDILVGLLVVGTDDVGEGINCGSFDSTSLGIILGITFRITEEELLDESSRCISWYVSWCTSWSDYQK